MPPGCFSPGGQVWSGYWLPATILQLSSGVRSVLGTYFSQVQNSLKSNTSGTFLTSDGPTEDSTVRFLARAFTLYQALWREQRLRRHSCASARILRCLTDQLTRLTDEYDNGTKTVSRSR